MRNNCRIVMNGIPDNLIGCYECFDLRERRPEFAQMYSEFRKKYGVGA